PRAGIGNEDISIRSISWCYTYPQRPLPLTGEPSPTAWILRYGHRLPHAAALFLQGRPPQAPAGVLSDGPAGVGLPRGGGAVSEPACGIPAVAGVGARPGRALAGAQWATSGDDAPGRGPV